MSYLSTLAARALEQPQPIRPRLPSLFEPLAGPRVNFRETAVNARAGVQRKPSRDPGQSAIPSETSNVTSPVRNRPEELAPELSPSQQIDQGRARIKSFSQSVESPTETPELNAGPVAERPALKDSDVVETAVQNRKRNSDGDDSSLLFSEKVEPAIQIAQAITLEETTVIERIAAATPQPLLSESKPSQTEALRPPVIVKPEVSVDHSQSQRIESQPATSEMAPSVRITIGRVDVRAIVSAPQLTVAPVRQPVIEALSLNDYLKQRNGEQR